MHDLPGSGPVQGKEHAKYIELGFYYPPSPLHDLPGFMAHEVWSQYTSRHLQEIHPNELAKLRAIGLQVEEQMIAVPPKYLNG